MADAVQDYDKLETFEQFLAFVNQTRERSLMEQIAGLDEPARERALDGIDPESLIYDWRSWARPSQLLPTGTWTTAVILAGRGWGKTRVGAEWVRDKAREFPGCRVTLLARTAADVRDVMVSGESGILNVCPPSERPDYVPSKRAMFWPNGSQALLATSMEPSVLRGPQSHFAWADEIGTYTHIPDESGLTAWQNLRIGNRLGTHPQVITTTTPKRVPAVEELVEEAASSMHTILVRGRTVDNIANLPRSYLEMLWNLYHGTHLWQQELEGLLIEGLEGALWDEEVINTFRISGLIDTSRIPLRVVAVDPSVAESPKDECGIVVVGSSVEKRLDKRHAYVLEDATVMGPPDKWVKAVVETSKRWRAPVVAEGNQGQALVKMALQSAGIDMPVFLVNARNNKQTRAEPAAVAYQAGRVHHWNHLPELESQLTTWIPGESKKSPDRLDALVWGITALLVKPPKGLYAGPIRAKSAAKRTMPGIRKQSYAGHRSRRAA